ncbi:jacalin-related lectin 3-like isoform X1 [Ananas comosus]|uniref:Jacalin-related lectin 3-like isoform X1 n=1 Tax=Ananas comosus TaxID=4615 RepID=A0A6P5EVF0_ANACO|nr:jacalin-related lectin 3-like isoform X1 [Ananas comosus]
MLIKMGPCGGSGGSQRDMNMTGVTRIVKIVVRSGRTIDAVSFSYERSGELEWSPQLGGSGGSINEINFARNEYLTSVMGYYGYYKKCLVVRSLTFVSNLQTYGPYGRVDSNLQTYGPYGCQDGILFALPSTSGKIIGFHARSGVYLDAIGTYVWID